MVWRPGGTSGASSLSARSLRREVHTRTACSAAVTSFTAAREGTTSVTRYSVPLAAAMIVTCSSVGCLLMKTAVTTNRQ